MGPWAYLDIHGPGRLFSKAHESPGPWTTGSGCHRFCDIRAPPRNRDRLSRRETFHRFTLRSQQPKCEVHGVISIDDVESQGHRLPQVKGTDRLGLDGHHNRLFLRLVRLSVHLILLVTRALTTHTVVSRRCRCPRRQFYPNLEHSAIDGRVCLQRQRHRADP